VTFVIPSAKGPADTGLFIVQSIWQSSLGRRWAEFLLFIAVVAQCFCTIASVTSASRMMFAFSRDRAVPGHQIWKRVSTRDRVPIYTVWAICGLAFLLVVPSLWFGYTGYVVATSVAVIGLYIAFVLPIILRLRRASASSAGPAPGPSLRVDRLARHPLDRVHLARLLCAVLLCGNPLEQRFRGTCSTTRC
jgi:amino acid transporter